MVYLQLHLERDLSLLLGIYFYTSWNSLCKENLKMYFYLFILVHFRNPNNLLIYIYIIYALLMRIMQGNISNIKISMWNFYFVYFELVTIFSFMSVFTIKHQVCTHGRLKSIPMSSFYLNGQNRYFLVVLIKLKNEQRQWNS